MRKFRIALVGTTLSTGGVGGVSRVLTNVANDLCARGHEVTIVTHEKTEMPPPFPIDPRVERVFLQRLNSRRGWLRREVVDRARRIATRTVFQSGAIHRAPLGRITWLNQYGAYPRRLGRWLDKERPDVAIAFLPPSLVAVAHADCRAPVARILSSHIPPATEFAIPERGRADNPYQRRLMKESLPRFDAVTVLLDEFRDWFPPEMRDRVHVVPNALPATAPDAASTPRDRVAMFVGRLSPQKAPDIAIDAWSRIAARFPDWTLEIYGDGPMKADCAERIAQHGLGERIRLMGTAPDIPDRLLRAALLVHPSEYEGFGLVVAEAMSQGTPAIGFADCPGVNTLIRDDGNGVLVDAGADRVDAFARGIEGLLADPERRRRLGAAGPASMAPYSPERIGDLWEKVIADAMERRRTTASGDGEPAAR